jgi:beta-phosphoglucomutase-like phosphatase (HAD superfamily)
MSSLPHTDKIALSGSQAGMRFIAQMKLYNDQNLERLQAFIADSYADALLQDHSAQDRLAECVQMLAQLGRQKVHQVLASGKHQVSVVMLAEKVEGFFYVEVQVEEDYPHKISKFLHAPLEIVHEDE